METCGISEEMHVAGNHTKVDKISNMKRPLMERYLVTSQGIYSTSGSLHLRDKERIKIWEYTYPIRPGNCAELHNMYLKVLHS